MQQRLSKETDWEWEIRESRSYGQYLVAKEFNAAGTDCLFAYRIFEDADGFVLDLEERIVQGRRELFKDRLLPLVNATQVMRRSPFFT